MEYFYPNYNIAHPAVKQGLVRIGKVDLSVEVYDGGQWRKFEVGDIPQLEDRVDVLEQKVSDLETAVGTFEIQAEAIIGEGGEA